MIEKPRGQDSQSEMSSQPQQMWHAGGRKEERQGRRKVGEGEERKGWKFVHLDLAIE